MALYMTRLQVVVRPELVPSKDLQKSLTLPVHQIALDALIRDADEPARHRLNSLATPIPQRGYPPLPSSGHFRQ